VRNGAQLRTRVRTDKELGRVLLRERRATQLLLDQQAPAWHPQSVRKISALDADSEQPALADPEGWPMGSTIPAPSASGA